jgi:hypothetical protein
MTTTTNRGYSTPATGANPGTWGAVDINPNFVLIDNNLGGVASVALSNTNVTLTVDQYQCGTIVLSGTLTANVLVLFPNVSGWWTVLNNCTGNFYVAARLAAGGNQIGLPPGDAWDILADGTNMKYRNLPHPIGGYWDDCGTTVPAWVTACTVPPYLNCDGASFSQVTYPYLYAKLGGTTLPDARGRSRFSLNQGTNRLTTAGGFNGDSVLNGGGTSGLTLVQAYFPNISLNVVIPAGQGSHVHSASGGGGAYLASVPPGAGPLNIAGGGAANVAANGNTDAATLPQLTGTAALGGSATPMANVPPGYVGGITMIRAGG